MIAVGLAAAVVSITVGLGARAARRERSARRARRDLRAAIHVLVAELQAGGRPADALASAGEFASPSAFRTASAAARRGEDVAAALAHHAGLAPVAVAWAVAARDGAPLSDVLSRVAADLDAREAQADRVAAALAGPRASAALLSGMPVVGVLLGSSLGARPLSFLIGTPAGHLALLGGVVLDAAGAVWTWALTARAARPP